MHQHAIEAEKNILQNSAMSIVRTKWRALN